MIRIVARCSSLSPFESGKEWPKYVWYLDRELPGALPTTKVKSGLSGTNGYSFPYTKKNCFSITYGGPIHSQGKSFSEIGKEVASQVDRLIETDYKIGTFS